MGGYGSSRWAFSYLPKGQIEGSIGLSVAVLRRYAPMGSYRGGSFTWQPSGANVNYFLADDTLTLSYRLRRGTDDAWQDRQDTIHLEATPQPFGGVRWWFLCPVCEHRRASLYLDQERWRFACRVCAGLVYRSSQAHDKTLDRYKHTPGLARATIEALLASERPGAALSMAATKAAAALGW